MENNSEFLIKQTKRVCELFANEARDIARSKGISIYEAELRLVASMVGPDIFYKGINDAINMNSTPEQSAKAIEHLKQRAWLEVKSEYRETASREVKEELSKPRTRPEEAGKC